MRYLRLFESFDKSKIDEICRKYDIKNYTINSDGSIDVNAGGLGSLLYFCLSEKKLTKLPLKFNKVLGIFDCSWNELTTLKGSPIELNAFDCHENKLVSFEYSPKIIKGFFDCRSNNIKTFEYFPRYLGGVFYCTNNPICEIWNLFLDISKIELLNDFDIFRDEDTDEPAIVMDRLNDFLLTIGKDTVEKVDRYKNI